MLNKKFELSLPILFTISVLYLIQTTFDLPGNRISLLLEVEVVKYFHKHSCSKLHFYLIVHWYLSSWIMTSWICRYMHRLAIVSCIWLSKSWSHQWRCKQWLSSSCVVLSLLPQEQDYYMLNNDLLTLWFLLILFIITNKKKNIIKINNIMVISSKSMV